MTKAPGSYGIKVKGVLNSRKQGCCLVTVRM